MDVFADKTREGIEERNIGIQKTGSLAQERSKGVCTRGIQDDSGDPKQRGSERRQKDDAALILALSIQGDHHGLQLHQEMRCLQRAEAASCLFMTTPSSSSSNSAPILS